MDDDSGITYGSIKDTVRDKVSDVLWLDHLKAQEDIVKQRIKSQILTDERCMVCTLPYGSCEHTRQWLDITLENNEMEGWKSSLDKEIDDMMSVFNDGFQIDTVPADEDLDLDGMQWNRLEQRTTDKIGASEFSLFAPDERGWHSTVKLTDKMICVFGGFRYKKNVIPQPFKAVPNPLDIEYLNDVRIYDVDNLCWYGVKANGRKGEVDGDENIETDHPIEPEGRYGHVAVALDESRMLIHGGRGFHGKIFNDTWIYHQKTDRWEWIHANESINMPTPLARYFSSAVTAPRTNNVYLFGGTNGVENFGDLWMFRGNEGELRWERLVAVGMPPCPRYGHQCVVIGDEQLAILGGCHVSPSGELVGSNLSTTETKSLIELSSILSKRYKAEGTMAKHGGQALESNIEHTMSLLEEGGSSLIGGGNTSALSASYQQGSSTVVGSQQTHHVTDVLHQASHLSSSLHLLEQDTRIAELNMMNTYKLSHASKNFNIHQAKHSVNNLDIVFLSLKETMWKQQLFPPIKGKIPLARIHFGAACIAKYLFVFGGIEPMSKAYKQVDERYTKINILNLESMKWDCKIPTNSADYLIQPLKIAEADIIRAKQRIQEERARGRMLGALNGKTVELAEAEAILKVCEWRKGVLLKEESDCLDPPHPRFGCSLTSLHQRLIYCGGWYPDRAVPQGDVMVLNLEQEHERLRRLSDEFTARLSRDRIAEEAAATMANVQSIYELRAMREEEQRNMLREQKEMLLEEFLSGLAPLTQPRPVKCVKVNQHTMWVKWDRINKNSQHQLVDPASVTYMLYARIGLESLLVNDKVTVLMPFPVESPKKKKKLLLKPVVVEVPNSGKADFDVEKFWYFNEKRRRKTGEITQVHDNGTYDVLYDDGNSEKGIPRSRMRLQPPPPPPPSAASTDVSAVSSRASSRPGTAESRGSAISASNRPGTSDSASFASKPGTASSRRSAYEDFSNSRVIIPAVVKRRQQSKTQKKRRAQKTLDKFRKPLQSNKILYGTGNSPNTSRATSRGGSRPTSRPTSRPGTSRNNKLTRSASGLSSVSRSPESSRLSARGGGYDFLSEMDALIASRPGSPGDKIGGGYTSSAAPSPVKNNKKNKKAVEMAIEEPAAAPPKPTVKIDDTKWKLVYMGPDCEYICGNIVPTEVLEREPGIVVSVAFCVQTLGLDDPIYETSQLSEPAYFTTSKPPAIKTFVKNSNALVVTGNTSVKSQPVEEESASVIGTTMSKTKKDIISAVINGQQMINMERRNNSYLSEGMSDHYL